MEIEIEETKKWDEEKAAEKERVDKETSEKILDRIEEVIWVSPITV